MYTVESLSIHVEREFTTVKQYIYLLGASLFLKGCQEILSVRNLERIVEAVVAVDGKRNINNKPKVFRDARCALAPRAEHVVLLVCG